MFERFTPEARKVISQSQDVARKRNINFIGTEHVAMALLELHPDFWGLLPDTAPLMRELEATMPEGERPASGHIPFTPHAKTMLELALRAALSLDHNYVAPEHLLLGLLRDEDSTGGKVLLNAGLDLETCRAVCAESLPQSKTLEPGQPDLLVLLDSLDRIAKRLREALFPGTN